MGLAKSGGPGLDPDAAAYIALIEGDGETVSGTQRAAIDTFYKTGKSEGWYSSLKRLYLPIWGAASPNARCLVSGTSGTFTVSGVTHGAGFVQGDGANGWFDFGASAVSLSILTNSAFCGFLITGTPGGSFEGYVGARLVGDSAINSDGANLYVVHGAAASGAVPLAKASQSGIIGFTVGATNIEIRRRTTAGAASVGGVGVTPGGTLPAANYGMMCRNDNGTPILPSDEKFGACWVGLGVTTTNHDGFTLALKNLWETCTGLTLP